MKNNLFSLCVLAAVAILAAAGCVRIKSDPVNVRVEPIHITVDVNVKVDRELDSFFGDLDAKPAPPKAPDAKPDGKG